MRGLGWPQAELLSRSAEVSFASIDALVSAKQACVWTLGGVLDDGQFARLRAEAQRELQAFVRPDGRVAFDMPALLIHDCAA